MALRFSPRGYYVLLTAVAVPLFIALGFWQWQRGAYRSMQWQAFVSADVPAVQTSSASLPRLPRYTRVSVNGTFDAQQQFLLDNISHQGAPGYEVLSVFALADGTRLLVNRGWVPFSGFREQLPDVSLAPQIGPGISGRLADLPVAGMASGRMPPPATGTWPRVTSFPTFAQLEQSLGAQVLPVVLLLDADSGPGYLRNWQPPGVSPDRNFSYAVQWWAFALLALGMFVGFNLKKIND